MLHVFFPSSAYLPIVNRNQHTLAVTKREKIKNKNHWVIQFQCSISKGYFFCSFSLISRGQLSEFNIFSIVFFSYTGLYCRGKKGINRALSKSMLPSPRDSFRRALHPVWVASLLLLSQKIAPFLPFSKKKEKKVAFLWYLLHIVYVIHF